MKYKKIVIIYFKFKNITKVNIIWKKKSLIEDIFKLIDYCHFAFTIALRIFWIIKSTIIKFLNEWQMSKIAIFDVFDVKLNKTIIFIKILWQIFIKKSQSRIKLNFITLNIELLLFKYIILCDKKKRFTLTTFITMHRFIFLCFKIFNFEFKKSFELLNLHTKENWYQTLCLIFEY